LDTDLVLPFLEAASVAALVCPLQTANAAP
jgi:hypothetical protein